MPHRNPVDQPTFEERVDKAGKYRLHISVPNPISRLNLGMPWYEKRRETTSFDAATRRFGYKGISLQTDSYFFADIEKHTLFHSGKSVQLQAGKEWLQYSDSSSWVASKKDATFAAEKRLTLVAGAGQGPRKPLHYGMDVRLDPYNNLHLHYCVDSVMMGVAEFMTGRRQRAERLGQRVYDSRMAHLADPHAGQSGQGGADYEPEGFYDVLKRAREELLGGALPDLAGLEPYFPKYPKNSRRSKHHEYYGYGKKYFSSFDPYEKKKVEGAGMALAVLKNGLAGMRRVMDVMNYLAYGLEDIELLRLVTTMSDALANFDAMLGEAEGLASVAQPLPANTDNVQFGHSAEMGQQYDQLFEELGRSVQEQESRRSEVAELRFAAPAVSAGSFAWQVPPGAYGYLYVQPNTPSPRRMHTNVVRDDRPQLSFRSTLDASIERMDAPSSRWIWLGTESGNATFTFETSSDRRDVEVAAWTFSSWLASELTSFAEMSPGGAVVVASRSMGSGAFVEVRADSTDTLRRIGLSAATPFVRVEGTGSGLVTVTPLELAELIRNQVGQPRPDGIGIAHSEEVVSVEVNADTGVITLRAEAPAGDARYAFYITAGGPLFEAVGPSLGSVGPLHDNVPVRTFHDDIADLQRMTLLARGYLDSPSGFVSAVAGPVADVLQRAFDATQAAIKAVEALHEFLDSFTDVTPKVPSAIGLFAKDGISLGTTDRLVSAAGKGYVFIADGGTGQPDWWKFVPLVEEAITTVADGRFKQLYTSSSASPSGSGAHGFTVLSNSDANIITRSNLELLAIGSQLVPGAEEGAPTALGKGVARLAATRRVEVLGTNEVLIAAGSALGDCAPLSTSVEGSESDGSAERGKSQVEVHAHRIAIGAFVPRDAPSVNEVAAYSDQIPWPNDGEPTLTQKKALESRGQSRVVTTERVDVRATDAMLLMLGGEGNDLERAEARVRAARARVERLQEARDEEWLAAQSGLSATLDPLDPLPDPRALQAIETELTSARENERNLQRLVELLQSGVQQLRAAIDVQATEIRIGFCDGGGRARWGPHLRITDHDIKLMYSDNSPVSVVVDENAASVRGGGDTLTVGPNGTSTGNANL